MKDYRAYDRATGLFVGIVSLETTENKSKYEDFILQEV